MLKRLRQLRSQIVTENPWWQYRRDAYVRPDGNEGEFHYVHTQGSVFVIPITGDAKIVMLRQYRYLNQCESIEFCGGGMKPELGVEGSARAELREEAGYDADVIVKIGAFNPMNGVTDERCHVFIATGLKPASALADTTEEFERFELSIAECSQLIREGTLWDGMTLAAFALLREHRPDLFTL